METYEPQEEGPGDLVEGTGTDLDDCGDGPVAVQEAHEPLIGTWNRHAYHSRRGKGSRNGGDRKALEHTNTHRQRERKKRQKKKTKASNDRTTRGGGNGREKKMLEERMKKKERRRKHNATTTTTTTTNNNNNIRRRK